MRGAGIVAGCVGVALLVSGCDTLEWRYTREGIGADLYTPEVVDGGRLQELYVGYICQQAGLAFEQIGDVLVCREPPVSRTWEVFVQAGLNDIDRRCDGYLTWLDNKRRSVGPIHQQILDTEAATLAIIGITAVDPTKAIAVVGAAFGLAAHSFTNFNSRFIFEVEKSTVQSVVLTRQQKYRETLPLIIDNRPAAIYALRQYLRPLHANDHRDADQYDGQTLRTWWNDSAEAVRGASDDRCTDGKHSDNTRRLYAVNRHHEQNSEVFECQSEESSGSRGVAEQEPR